ncbi:MAG: glycoside hydrolase family 26 protein [Treponema sp.]|jgi:mannan endo-1,4-beta-mannosidase|nr:glycoside hydrolase family 26 protein [Treponema sp.]
MKIVNAFILMASAMASAVVFNACASKSKPSEAALQSAEETAVKIVILSGKSPNTRRLLNYLADEYGKHIISGQMDTSWTTNEDSDMIARVYADTGKYPAIKGFDFIQLPYDRGVEQTDEAVEWWKGENNGETLVSGKHGIVTFCWHWRAGRKDFYTQNTDFRIPYKDGKLDVSSEAFAIIKEDLDKAAERLSELKEDDIPVLWRPLHEASGGWFWWGATGPAPYIALWNYMYDYFTNECGLDNLIWVWNGQNAAWYPGDDVIDIAGYDVYPQSAKDYGAQKALFTATESASHAKKIVAMTENGEIPDPDLLVRDGVSWSWFMTWNDGLGAPEGVTDKDNFWTGEYHNTNDHKRKVYNHDYVITLDELPDLTTYRDN